MNFCEHVSSTSGGYQGRLEPNAFCEAVKLAKDKNKRQKEVRAKRLVAEKRRACSKREKDRERSGSAAKKLRELLACAHPLLVDDDTIPEFPYWNIGTCFLIRFAGNLYLVTAKHCLENHKAEPEQISIPVGSGSDEFILFDRIHRGDAEGAEDNDFADYVVMRAKSGSIPGVHASALNAFKFAADSVILPESPKVKNFLIRGYPRVLNEIDYENKRIPRKSFTFDGTYAGPSGSKHCHALEYSPHAEVDDPDQISGSPVFGLVPVGTESTAKLAGMIIRSGKGSKFCQLISAQVLWSALNEALRQESRLTGEKSNGPA